MLSLQKSLIHSLTGNLIGTSFKAHCNKYFFIQEVYKKLESILYSKHVLEYLNSKFCLVNHRLNEDTISNWEFWYHFNNNALTIFCLIGNIAKAKNTHVYFLSKSFRNSNNK